MTAAAEAHAASLLALFPAASSAATAPQDSAPATSSPSSARTPAEESSAETAKRLKRHRICQVRVSLPCAGDFSQNRFAWHDASVRPNRQGVKGRYCCTRARGNGGAGWCTLRMQLVVCCRCSINTSKSFTIAVRPALLNMYHPSFEVRYHIINSRSHEYSLV